MAGYTLLTELMTTVYYTLAFSIFVSKFRDDGRMGATGAFAPFKLW